MYENLKEEYDEKILALAEYLDLEENEIEEIYTRDFIKFEHNRNYYYVLTEKEADDKVNDLVQYMVDEIQWDLNRDLIPYSRYLQVDEYAVQEEYGYNSISENWKEVGDYCIFEI